MKFKSIEELNLFINEYDEVDFVGKNNEVEFLELINKKLETCKTINPFKVNEVLIELEEEGMLDKFC